MEKGHQMHQKFAGWAQILDSEKNKEKSEKKDRRVVQSWFELHRVTREKYSQGWTQTPSPKIAVKKVLRTETI